MSTRISGLISGLDTESIISQLVEVKQAKIDTQTKAQTKLSWKQDAWKELNTKIKNLQQKYLSNMRFASDYAKMTTKVSNSNAVSVITGDNAVEGVQELEVNKLAKTGYLTGAKISDENGGSLTATSKLSDLGFTGSGSFTVTTGSTTVNVDVTENTSISDVLTSLKNAGLNASFDQKQQRFFVSSKKSGEANDFNIAASNAEGLDALSKLGLSVKAEEGNATYNTYKSIVDDYDDETKRNAAIDSTVASRTASYLEQYKSLKTSIETSQKRIDEINDKYTDLKSVDDYDTDIETANSKISELQEKIENETDADAKAELEEQLKTAKDDLTDLETRKADAQTIATEKENIDKYNADIETIAGTDGYITVTEDADGNYSADATTKLEDVVKEEYYNRAETARSVINGTASGDNYATKVDGRDALITLNGATFTSNDNVFEINGLTFTALSETNGEKVTVTTAQDTDGIYDMIKNYLKEYNTLINEMDKLYNADSASGYEPLTDDEKESMSDSEIEKYETKIKDALLRRDENLNTVSNTLKTAMSTGFTVNGKTMYLSDFGISTLGYFSAADNEKNAYHIDGDPDDSDTSSNADKLKSMISTDSDTVISFFTQLSKNLYSKMSDLSKSVNGYRSYGNFYDDKKMKTEYSDYTTKISELEEKMNDYEDKLYSKYSAMETALAKLQSNSSAVTALLGG
jgi:flagellar hook-associated protein 2